MKCSIFNNVFFLSGDGSQSDNEESVEPTSDQEDKSEKEKTDQSQQTTPTTPPADAGRIIYFLVFSGAVAACKAS